MARKQENTDPSNEELKNHDKLLFLLTDPEFKERSKRVKNDHLPVPSDPKKLLKWFEKLNNELEKICLEYRLPKHFCASLYNYFVNAKEMPQKRNYSIGVNPVAELNHEGKVVKYAEEIILKTYAPLSSLEWKLARQRMKWYWNTFFHPNVAKRVNLRDKDVHKKYDMEAEMENRILHPVEEYTPYLQSVKNSYGDKEFERTKKLNPESVTKRDRYTSKDISEKIFKGKKTSGALRTSLSKLKARRKNK